MEMDVKLYQFESKAREVLLPFDWYIDKGHITRRISFVTLDVDSPSFSVTDKGDEDLTRFNYAEIPQLKRWYDVESITLERGELVKFNLSTNLLLTHNELILKSKYRLGTLAGDEMSIYEFIKSGIKPIFEFGDQVTLAANSLRKSEYDSLISYLAENNFYCYNVNTA